MSKKEVNNFITKIQNESQIKKIVNMDIINQLIDTFDKKVDKKEYPNTIDSCFDPVLSFFKEYDPDGYYQLIMDVLNDEEVIRIMCSNYISKPNGKSYVEMENGEVIAHVHFIGDDSDAFMLVHELAHYIDKVKNIIPDEYWFLSETFAIYMEKIFEKWLIKEEYNDLIEIRKNNRKYYESKMMNAIKIELYYEDLYKKGILNKSSINVEDLELLMAYNESNLVNYLLQYPLANVISNCLIHKDYVSTNRFVEECLNVDLYKAIKNFNDEENKARRLIK